MNEKVQTSIPTVHLEQDIHQSMKCTENLFYRVSSEKKEICMYFIKGHCRNGGTITTLYVFYFFLPNGFDHYFSLDVWFKVCKLM